jgi:signal transduction histidine kinase
VEVDVPDREVVCDANLVVLAIANLLDNAAKYGDPEQPIRLTAGDEREMVWIAVADRGRGIPAAEQRHIFQRFYRAKNALERKGMGLGLFLVQKIADLHGGKVEFQSREGVGTTFTLRLPIRTVPGGVRS